MRPGLIYSRSMVTTDTPILRFQGGIWRMDGKHTYDVKVVVFSTGALFVVLFALYLIALFLVGWFFVS